MCKHAFLIIAHNEFYVLQRLVQVLDDCRNDIYVHFDKKVSPLPTLECHNARLFVLSDEERVNVIWGTVSQIRTELSLFSCAKKNGPYKYYHLLSGVHLPLWNLNDLYEFYEKEYPSEIMSLWDSTEEEADFKLRRYHFGCQWMKSKKRTLRMLGTFVWRACLFVQKKLGIRCNKKQTFIKASNWLSLSENAVSYLLERRLQLEKMYRYAFCPDEYFVPTVLSEHPELFRIRHVSNLLYVCFYKASPLEITMEDYEQKRMSSFMYARKFTEKHMDVVDCIVNDISRQGQI